jgi:cytochrome b561
MERNSKSARVDEKRAKPASGRFDLISITMHWLTVLLILVQFTSAWQRGALDQNTNFAVALLTTHRTSGVLIWIVSLVRLVWRHNFAYLPPFPKSMPKLHQTLAKANEYSLYALLLIQPITGLGRSLFGGAPFELFIWQVPVLFAKDDAIRHMFVEAHEYGADALLALIGLHAGAALVHRFTLRDGVLHRMLPWGAPPVGLPESKARLAVSDVE